MFQAGQVQHLINGIDTIVITLLKLVGAIQYLVRKLPRPQSDEYPDAISVEVLIGVNY